jgi:uncharacterized Zn finger protein
MQQPTQPRVNVNPNDLTDIVCPDCGDLNFKQVVRMKKLSALLSPDGQEQVVSIPIFICNECGGVPKEFANQLQGGVQ